MDKILFVWAEGMEGDQVGGEGPSAPSHPLLQPGHGSAPEGLPKCVGKAGAVAMLILLWVETQLREQFLLTSSWRDMLGQIILISSVLSAWIVFSLQVLCHIFGDKFTLSWWPEQAKLKPVGTWVKRCRNQRDGWSCSCWSLWGSGLFPMLSLVSCVTLGTLGIRAFLLSACLACLSVCNGNYWGWTSGATGMQYHKVSLVPIALHEWQKQSTS